MTNAFLPSSNLSQLLKQQRQMQKTLEPFKVQQLGMLEAMQPIFKQQREMQKAQEQLMLRYSSMMDSLKFPTTEIARKLQKTMEPFQALQLHMLDARKPILEQQRQMQKAMEPLRLMFSQMPLKAISANIEELQSQYPEYTEIEFQETNDEAIYQINDESISAADVTSALEKLLARPSNESIIEAIETLKSNNLRTIVANTIISFLIALFFYALSSADPQVPRTDLRDLKEAAQTLELNVEHKKHLRFVYVKTVLHVRGEGYIHAEVIDILQPGTTVFLIEKHKSWSKVSYSDPLTHETHTGWVFSRYLRKFE